SYVSHDLLICSAFILLLNPSPPQTYTLSLHDALPILNKGLVTTTQLQRKSETYQEICRFNRVENELDLFEYIDEEIGNWWFNAIDRKSTRLNSSHVSISYAVFCLKKKKNKKSEWPNMR